MLQITTAAREDIPSGGGLGLTLVTGRCAACIVAGMRSVSYADVVGQRATRQPRSSPTVAAAAVASDGRGVRASRAANLLNTIGHEATTALLPGFLVGTLLAAPAALGLIEGIAEGVGGASRVAGGELSAEPRWRRRISLLGYTGTAIFSALIGTVATAWQAGVLRSAAWTARGLRTPARYAAVPERVAVSRLGREFAAERAVEHLGAVGGPLFAFALLGVLGVRAAMLLTLIPGLVSVIFTVVALRRRGPGPAPRPVRFRAHAVWRGTLGRLLAAIALFEISNIAAALLILRATKLLRVDALGIGAVRTAVLLYILYRLAAGLIAPTAGRAVDRFGPGPVMAFGVLALLGSYAGFAASGQGIAGLAGCFLLAGAAIGAAETAELAGVGRLAANDLRWSAFGTLAALQSVGKLTSSTIAGTLWTVISPAAGLLFSAPLLLCSAVMLTLSVRDPAKAPAARTAHDCE
jgi:MFS family permease